MTIVPNVTVVIQMAIVLVLMLLLNSLLFKPMMRVLTERKARTQGRRERAASATAEADRIWTEYQTKLSEARKEAEKIRIELVAQGEAERNRVTSVAAAEAEKTVADLKARVAEEAVKAKDALKAEIDGIAKAMAEKIAGRAV